MTMEWQPIEIATKENEVRRIFLTGSNTVFKGYWNDDEQNWTTESGMRINPTYWMPFVAPPPPKTKEEILVDKIEELEEEIQALVAALKHLVLVCRNAKMNNESLTYAENALRRHEL